MSIHTKRFFFTVFHTKAFHVVHTSLMFLFEVVNHQPFIVSRMNIYTSSIVQFSFRTYLTNELYSHFSRWTRNLIKRWKSTHVISRLGYHKRDWIRWMAYGASKKARELHAELAFITRLVPWFQAFDIH